MKKTFFLIALLLLFGCNEERISNEEILKDIVLQIVNKNAQLQNGGSNKIIVVGINENILRLEDFEIDQLKSLREVWGMYFEDKLPKIDSVSLIEPLNDLINQKRLGISTINIPEMTLSNNLEILSNKQIGIKYSEKKLDSSKVELGRQLRITNIYLDKKQNNGLFVFDYYCGGDCGQGNLVFIKLIDGKWTIIKQEVMWVS